MKYAVESINNDRKDKHVMRHVFTWEEVPRNKNQTADLREFLKQKFDLKWLDNANQPEKLDDDNTLRISYRSNLF